MASRSRRIIVRSLLGSVLVLLVAGLTLVYLVRRTPAWFAKIEMTDEQRLDEYNTLLRVELPNFTNKVDEAATQPSDTTFSLTLTEAQLHAYYLSHAEQTDTTKLIASKVQDPQVRMRDGQFILAGRVPGVESVVNARFTFEQKPDGSGGVFKLAGIYGGSLPMPETFIAGQRDFVVRALDGEVSRRRGDVKTDPPDETTLKLLTAVNAIDLLNGKPVESTVILKRGVTNGYSYARVINATFADGRAVLTFRLANEREIAEVVQRVKKGE